MAALSPVLKFVMEGVDRASATIKGVRKEIDRTTAGVEKASGRLATLRSGFASLASGDVAGALSSLTSGLGPKGIAGKAALAAAGIAAVGVAITIAAKKAATWAVEIERLRVGLTEVFGADSVKKAQVFADAIGGVSVQKIAEFAGALKAAGVSARITTEQIQELAARATVVGKTGDDALSAFASAIKKGNTAALKQVGTFLNATAVMSTYAEKIGRKGGAGKLEMFEQQQAAVDAITRDLSVSLGIQSAAHDRLDTSLAALDNQFFLFKANISDFVGEAGASWLDWVTRALSAINDFSDALLTAVKYSSFFFYASKLVTVGYTTLFKVLNATKLVMQGKGKEAAEQYKEIGDMWRTEFQTVSDDITKIWGALFNERLPGITQAAITSQGNLIKMVMAQWQGVIGALTKPGKKAKPKRRAAKKASGPTDAAMLADALAVDISGEIAGIDIRQRFLQSEVSLLTDAEAAQRAKLKSILAELGVRKELLQLEMRGLQETIPLEQTKRFVISEQLATKKELITREKDSALAALVKAQTDAAEKAAKKATETEAKRTAAIWATSAATAAGIAGMIEHERARAAVLAAISVADSFRLFALGNIPGGISAGFAAAAYAKAAMVGTGSTAGGGGGGIASGFAARNGMQYAGAGGGGATIITNYNGLFETTQSLAKKQSAVAASLSGSGV